MKACGSSVRWQGLGEPANSVRGANHTISTDFTSPKTGNYWGCGSCSRVFRTVSPIHCLYSFSLQIYSQLFSFWPGGPGSGKALQSEKIEERYSLKRLCPGDILCSELQSHSERGRFLRDLLERGEQLPEVQNLAKVHYWKLQWSASPFTGFNACGENTGRHTIS